MIDWTSGLWADVVPGDLVFGRDRHEWTVLDIEDGITMTRPGRDTLTGRPKLSDPVRYAPGVEHRAVDAVQAVFAECGMSLVPVRTVTAQEWLVGWKPGRRRG